MTSKAVKIENIKGKVSSQEELVGSYEYVIAFHGTSHRFLPRIKKSGLKPRDISGINSNDPNASQKGKVYFGPLKGKRENGAKWAAKRTVSNVGGKEIAIKAILETKKLLPDEDSKASNAYLSAKNFGTIAYQGTVKPNQIKDVNELSDVKPPKNIRELMVKIYKEAEEKNIEKNLENLKNNLSKSVDPVFKEPY